jgi:dCTP deaminase
VDLRLAGVLTYYDGNWWKPLSAREDCEPIMLRREYGKGEPIYIEPGKFYLGSTVEWLALGPSLVGRLDGRSSHGRRGLLVHATAGYVDPGFIGTLTLEMMNVNHFPIILYAGMRICQLSLMRLTSEAARPYAGKYNGQEEPTESRLHLDKEGDGREPSIEELEHHFGISREVRENV